MGSLVGLRRACGACGACASPYNVRLTSPKARQFSPIPQNIRPHNRNQKILAASKCAPQSQPSLPSYLSPSLLLSHRTMPSTHAPTHATSASFRPLFPQRQHPPARPHSPRLPIGSQPLLRRAARVAWVNSCIPARQGRGGCRKL